MAAQVLSGKHVPGLAIGIAEHGRIVFARGYGLADMAKNVPVTADTRFEIGSVTKQITAACVLQLVEAGKLSLDARLGSFVSDYFAGRGVTVRQLLEQVSGVPEYLAGDDVQVLAGTQPATYATLVARVSAKPLEFTPGTRWKYSNTNYILLGRIVELAAHESYEHYVRTHIFERAGMTQSGFIADEATLPAMARGYVPGPKGLAPSPPLRDDWATSAGAVVSTVGDVLRWDDALLAGKIVSPADVALMRTTATTVDGAPTHYGFGWIVDTAGTHPRVWHNGGTFGFHAINQTFPADDEAIVVLDNSAFGLEGFAPALFAATHPDAPPPVESAAGEVAAVRARVREWLHRFETGDIDRSQLTAAMTKSLTPDIVDGAKAQLGPLGEPQSLLYRGVTNDGGSTVYHYRATFTQGTFDITMAVDATGKIGGYLLTPG